MDLKTIKRLITMVEGAQISHLCIQDNDTTIEIRKEFGQAQASVVLPQAVPQMMAPQPVAAPAAAPVATEAAPAASPEDEGLVPIKAQMVGTMYHASNPDSPPFVKVGDSIKQGQVICIIEAMKLFNEIESEVNGTIEKICVDNGQPIEYGQDLFFVRPA